MPHNKLKCLTMFHNYILHTMKLRVTILESFTEMLHLTNKLNFPFCIVLFNTKIMLLFQILKRLSYTFWVKDCIFSNLNLSFYLYVYEQHIFCNDADLYTFFLVLRDWTFKIAMIGVSFILACPLFYQWNLQIDWKNMFKVLVQK